MQRIILLISTLVVLRTQSASVSYVGTIFNKDREQETLLEFDDESELDDWTTFGVNLTTAADVTGDTSDSDGVLVPGPASLDGNDDHTIRKDFTIEAGSSLEIEFSLFVSGYNSSAEVAEDSGVPNTNPSFKIIIADKNTDETREIDISRLEVVNDDWQTMEWKVRNEDTANVTVMIKLAENGQKIALDYLKITWIPVLESEKDVEHEEVLFAEETTTTSITTTSTTTTTTATTATEATTAQATESASTTTTTTTTTTAATTSPTTTTSNSTPQKITETTTSETNQTEATTETTTTVSKENETTTTAAPEETTTTTTTKSTSTVTENETTTTAATTTTTKAPEGETTTTTSTSSETEATKNTETTKVTTTTATPSTAAVNVTKATDSPTTATSSSPEASSTTSQSTLTPSELSKPDSGSGSAVQIVLIILTIVFGCLFLFMVVKYYHLRNSIGDYRLQHGAGGPRPTSQNYDNPAFSGFGMSDSYRSR